MQLFTSFFNTCGYRIFIPYSLYSQPYRKKLLSIIAFEFPLILLFVIFTSAITEIADKIRLGSFFVVLIGFACLSFFVQVLLCFFFFQAPQALHMFYYYFIIYLLCLVLAGIAFAQLRFNFCLGRQSWDCFCARYSY